MNNIFEVFWGIRVKVSVNFCVSRALIVMYTLGHLLDQIMVALILVGRRRFDPPYFWSWDEHSTTSPPGKLLISFYTKRKFHNFCS